MSDNNAATAGAPDGPAFRLRKLYVKDLSFENPNAPEIYFATESQPKVDMNLGLKNRKLDDEHWEVSLNITAKIVDEKNDKTLFIVEVEHAGSFYMKNIPEEHMPMVLGVECPTVIFPYTRQIVSQASVDGGFMPFLMEPVNFLALFENSRKKKPAEEDRKN